jgi:hypothetical protein
MNLLTKLFIILLLGFIFCINTNCKKTTNISYEGTVYDSLSSNNPKGASGVVVVLSACNGKSSGNTNQCLGSLYITEKATTDADGRFSIQSNTKLKNQFFYVGIENSPYSAANMGYLLSNLPPKLYMRY